MAVVGFGGLQFAADPVQTPLQVARISYNAIRKTSIDDIPLSVLQALETLGSRMPPIDVSLIAPASEALGSRESVWLENLKLTIGFSRDSTAAELRTSSSAITSFLLLTALGASMDTTEVANTFIAILERSEIIREAVVCERQAKCLTEVLYPHSIKFRNGGYMPTSSLEFLPKIAKYQTIPVHDMFYSISHDQLARILLEIFDAIRDQDVALVRVSGYTGAQTLIGVLYWLYPNETEVCSQGEAFLESRNQPARIRLEIETDSGYWKIETQNMLREPMALFDRTPDYDEERKASWDPYMDRYSTGYARVPPSLLFPFQQTGFSSSPALKYLSANVALGLVIAARKLSTIKRKALFSNDEVGICSIPFDNICSPSFNRYLEACPMLLGFSEDSVKYDLYHAFGTFFSEKNLQVHSGTKYTTVFAWKILVEFDQEIYDNKLQTNNMTNYDLSNSWRFGIRIADHLLSSATRSDFTDMPPFLIDDDPTSLRIIDHLLGPTHSILASEYLQLALIHAHGGNSGRAASYPLVALSGQGRVSYLKSLIQTPFTPHEAFEIAVQTGTLRWQKRIIRCLYDTASRFFPVIVPNPVIFTIDKYIASKTQSLMAAAPPFDFGIKKGEETDCPHLICWRPARGDPSSQFTHALINFALAVLMKPSNRSVEELHDIIQKAGADRLFLRHPDQPGLHCHPQSGKQMQAVATYNTREERPFLQFGSIDADGLVCILQGSASLLDCAAQAVERFNSGWVIWSDPKGL